MKNFSFKEILKSFLVISIVIFSIFVVRLVCEYAPQSDESLYLPYGATFFTPEHGRYISTFLLNFIVERIPIFFHSHYLDCFNVVFLVIFPIVVILIFLLAKSLLLFSKKSYVVFSCAYFFFFLFFYNTHIPYCEYMCTREIDILIFHIFPLIFYFLFYLFFVKNFLRAKVPKGKDFILILTLTFLIGFSAETENLFFFVFLSILTLVQIIEVELFKEIKKKSENKNFLKFIFTLDIVYMMAMFIYYSNPIDHSISLHNDFSALFAEFVKTFYEYVIKPYWMMPVISILTSLLILLTRKFHIYADNKMVIFSLVNLFALFLFFFFGNLLIEFVWAESERYSLCTDKFLLMFLLMLMLNVSVQVGYIAGTRLSCKKAKAVKLLVLVSALVFVKKLQIAEFIPTIIEKRNYDLNIREIEYKIYKVLYSQKHNNVVYFPSFDFDERLKNFYYIENHRIKHLVIGASHLSDDFNETMVIVYSPKIILPELTENEKSLRFSDFVIPKYQKGKDRFYKVDIKEEIEKADVSSN